MPQVQQQAACSQAFMPAAVPAFTGRNSWAGVPTPHTCDFVVLPLPLVLVFVGEVVGAPPPAVVVLELSHIHPAVLVLRRAAPAGQGRAQWRGQGNGECGCEEAGTAGQGEAFDRTALTRQLQSDAGRVERQREAHNLQAASFCPAPPLPPVLPPTPQGAPTTQLTRAPCPPSTPPRSADRW
jgi:hypothetical protein